MVLNYIWVAFFAIAFVVAVFTSIINGEVGIWQSIMNVTFTAAKYAFELCLGLVGVLSFWLGLMRIGEKSGVIARFSRLVSPLFSRIFPDIPKGHPASGSILMNISANMLGLDNAATPFGLKAMQDLQSLNKQKDTATDPMIMFLVLNTSGLTIIPISIMMYRSQLGAANPCDIFMPILIATFCSTIGGLIFCCIKQRINMLNKVILCTFGGAALFIGGILYLFGQMNQDQITLYSSVFSNALLFTTIMLFIFSGLRKKINIFSTFVEGAKEGFHTVVTIIPYQVAMLVGIAVFRECGAMNYIIDGLGWAFSHCGLPTDFVQALPTAIMKPLNGSGARGMMIDAINTYGVDSFVGRISSTIQGSTDTTLYILAVYFGSVNISKTRYAAGAGLTADLIGIIAAICVGYVFWG